MDNRIDKKFKQLKYERRGGFIPFLVAGDPDLQTTKALIFELAEHNPAVIELGIPFSDPVADGATIQAASARALKHSFSIKDIFRMIAEIRSAGCKTPIILFSYFNPILQFGLDKFAENCAAAGVDGVLITDLIDEEAGEFRRILRNKNLHLIMLAAPTSDDRRLQNICLNAGGFIYAISRAGVTGAKTDLSTEAENLVGRIRKFTKLPVAVGFGITNSEQIRQICDYADAAVVGSAIVSEISKSDNPKQVVENVKKFVESLYEK